jgi:hypothetical protein
MRGIPDLTESVATGQDTDPMGVASRERHGQTDTPAMLEPDQWDAVIAGIKGTLVRGTERVTSAQVMDLLLVENDLQLRRRLAKRIAIPMRRCGWNGPVAMKRPNGSGTTSGYWRRPGQLPKPYLAGGDFDDETAASLPDALGVLTKDSIRKLHRIVRMPLDPLNAGLLRAQVTASLGAIQSQLRADEHMLKAKATGDVLERLLKIIEEERRLLPKDRPQLEAAAAVDGSIDAAARKGV